MNEFEEIKLRKVFFDAMYDYFSDNLPSHLYPPQRIESVSHDLTDLMIDAYESYRKME